MRLIWEKINDWKFWALANGKEEFYQLLLYNKINSVKGVYYEEREPFLSLDIPNHQLLLSKAKALLEPDIYKEFSAELFKTA